MSKFLENLNKLDLAISRFYEDDELLLAERRLIDIFTMVYSLIRSEYSRWYLSKND